jgi:hypothetical protein
LCNCKTFFWLAFESQSLKKTVYNIAWPIWRGGEHILGFLFANQLQLRQNNSRQQNKQLSFYIFNKQQRREMEEGMPPHRQCSPLAVIPLGEKWKIITLLRMNRMN